MRRAPWHEVLWQHWRHLLCWAARDVAPAAAAAHDVAPAAAAAARPHHEGAPTTTMSERPGAAFLPDAHLRVTPTASCTAPHSGTRDRPDAGGEPAEDASAAQAAEAAEAEASFEAQLQSRFPAAQGTDEQRAAAERLARLHAVWCREWRKPPPR